MYLCMFYAKDKYLLHCNDDGSIIGFEDIEEAKKYYNFEIKEEDQKNEHILAMIVAYTALTPRLIKLDNEDITKSELFELREEYKFYRVANTINVVFGLECTNQEFAKQSYEKGYIIQIKSNEEN